MPQNLSAQFVCPSPKVQDFNKKGFIGRLQSVGQLICQIPRGARDSPRPPVTIFILARLRGNLNSEATSKSLFILPYYGKFKAKATAEDQNHDSFLKN